MSIPNNGNDYITVHIVLKEYAKNQKESVIRKINAMAEEVDAIKYYDVFGINATSGKCDREAMAEDLNDYYLASEDDGTKVDFVKENDLILKRIKKNN